ncbi:nitrite reductase small subunit NirD [Williamsia sp. 1135]|uniref:nitrite reductase small subunit NirD n=1 Tax=Williamsia sp. 1135 TaxID=1889262 RepID=UPI000A117F41|nr:nitrite reductase small subunit NirD [Williamsia sp. 1135]ORM25133.1 nitrite reductase (NAD(P)H) small subunit [Williamsia sp. 1135]
MSLVDDTRATDVATTWTDACRLGQLVPGRGVAVLLPGGEQVALFLVPDTHVAGESGPTLYAVGNIDPFGRAAVMSRGLVGDRSGEPTVASPLLKQVFSLVDGRCLSDENVSLPVYDVRVQANLIQVRPR